MNGVVYNKLVKRDFFLDLPTEMIHNNTCFWKQPIKIACSQCIFLEEGFSMEQFSQVIYNNFFFSTSWENSVFSSCLLREVHFGFWTVKRKDPRNCFLQSWDWGSYIYIYVFRYCEYKNSECRSCINLSL